MRLSELSLYQNSIPQMFLRKKQRRRPEWGEHRPITDPPRGFTLNVQKTDLQPVNSTARGNIGCYLRPLSLYISRKHVAKCK